MWCPEDEKEKREEKKIRARLEEMWAEALFEGDLYQDSTREIRNFFSERGKAIQ